MAILTRARCFAPSARRGRGIGPPLYRQRRGQDRGSVVDAGFRPGRGYGVQEDRRRLREGQRQHDRPQHQPYAPMRQKIVSAVTSGVVPDHVPATTRPRSLRSTPGTTSWSMSATSSRRNGRSSPRPRCSRLLLQQRRRRSAAFTACLIPSALDRTISGGRWSRRPATRWRISRKPGMPITISSRTCRRNCAPRACAMSMASVFS